MKETPLVARQTLDDCRASLKLFRENRKTENWRVFWVAAITLLRMVGHVLRFVDRESSDLARNIIDEFWKDWEHEEIFSQFIKRDRDNLLKEYKFNIETRQTLLAVSRGGPLLSIDKKGTRLSVGTVSAISKGLFAGKDAIAQVESAIEWWEAKLSAVEEKIRSKRYGG